MASCSIRPTGCAIRATPVQPPPLFYSGVHGTLIERWKLHHTYQATTLTLIATLLFLSPLLIIIRIPLATTGARIGLERYHKGSPDFSSHPPNQLALQYLARWTGATLDTSLTPRPILSSQA
jgi:hypothetical protein